LSFCNVFGKKLNLAGQNSFDQQSKKLLTGKSQYFWNWFLNKIEGGFKDDVSADLKCPQCADLEYPNSTD